MKNFPLCQAYEFMRFVFQIVSRSSNLTIRVNEETTGKYYCKGHTDSFPDIIAEANVYMKGKPVILRQPVQFGVPGDNIKLDCIVYSIPKPERIMWSFNGRELGIESSEEYKVGAENLSFNPTFD